MSPPPKLIARYDHGFYSKRFYLKKTTSFFNNVWLPINIKYIMYIICI